MATIKQINGKYEQKLSAPDKKWVLTAGENNLFEVPEWIPLTIDNPKKITWVLKNSAKNTVFATINNTTLDKFVFAISPKYSGAYTYYVEAKLDGTSETAETAILGFCAQKITIASWDSAGKKELRYGDSIKIHIETEGLNGNQLQIEVYGKKNNQLVGSYKQECINGEVDFTITDTMNWKFFMGESQKEKKGENQSKAAEPKQPQPANQSKEIQTEQFYIKVKNSGTATYVKDTKGSEDVITLTLIDEAVMPTAVKPVNITPLKIGKADKSPISTGLISLEKIAVKTIYDVCNDEVKDFNDDENFWILENGGKYYHWLKKRTNTKDVNKPKEIPITLESTSAFVFHATFKTIFPADGLKIRVRDKDNKYIFPIMPHPKKARDEEYIIKFTSANTPYKDTVQYFPSFELIFECSFDEKSWTPLGNAQFCFYLTWKKPEFSKFENSTDETKTMKIGCSKSGKPNILETLLWLGCDQAKGIGNTGTTSTENENKILNAIFNQFITKKVVRRREGSYVTRNWAAEGMGYWRGISAVDAQSTLPPASMQPDKFYDAATSTHIDRTSRVILKYGEFRCGEWSDFFTYILMCQGILLDQFAIYSGRGDNQNYYFKIDPITHSVSYINPDLSKVTPGGSSIEYYYANWVFYVKGGWGFSDPNKPTLSVSTTNRAQGNTNPLHEFSDHIFVLFERSGKKVWFDPSYGLTSATKHPTNKDLLKEYASNALGRIGYVELQSGKYKTIDSNIHNHLITVIITGLFDLPSGAKDKAGVISIIDSLGNTIKTF
jgi:hypothetical protein